MKLGDVKSLQQMPPVELLGNDTSATVGVRVSGTTVQFDVQTQ
jgi:hypothetical protein